MLSDERIAKLLEPLQGTGEENIDWDEFIRIVERESIAPLIEQIKEDEALMRQLLSMVESMEPVHAWSTETRMLNALRQRLEAKK